MPQFGKLVQDAVGDLGRDDEHHADAHVKDAVHLGGRDVAQRLHPWEDRRHRPRVAVDHHLHLLGHDPREVLGQAAAGNVGNPVDNLRDTVFAEHRLDGAGVEPGRREERLGHGPAT